MTDAEPEMQAAPESEQPPGFSLLETLVVLVLMAMLSGLAMLTFTPSGLLAEQEADRLTRALETARDRAIVANMPVIVEIHEEGAQIRFLGENETGARGYIADRIAWADEVSIRAEGEALPSAVMFDALGNGSDKSFSVYADGAVRTVRVSVAGDVIRLP